MSDISIKEKKVKVVDEPLKPIPLDQRQHWFTPAMIFGGLEFCIPVLMIGSMMVASFDIITVAIIAILAMLLVTLPMNAIGGYVGARSGLSSSVLARNSFGEKQSRYLVSLMICIVGMGHWGLQTAVAGNAICAMMGIDYLTDRTTWAMVTIIVGFLFGLPSIIGYSSMKWTDYIAVPAGLLLSGFGIYLAFKNVGFSSIIAYKPTAPTMTLLMGFNLIISLNSAQVLLAMDYTRFAKPTWKDNLKIPFGVIGIGVPLLMVGALMAVGNGTYDIVQVMTNLGFPFWGFLVLWLSTWTSQLVNCYSSGLGLANMFNVNSNKGRMIATLVVTVLAIGLALIGILEHLTDLYSMTALVFPAIAGVIIADFFMRGEKVSDEEHSDWNWVATVGILLGGLFGYLTTFVIPFGIPAVQTLLVAVIVYYFGMKSKIVKAGLI